MSHYDVDCKTCGQMLFSAAMNKWYSCDCAKNELKRQINIAKQRRSDMAKSSPYMFREYLEYARAEEDYKAAKKKRKEKRKIWEGVLSGK